MDWLFSVNPSVVIGLASALGCLYFLCICAEETKTLLAYRRLAALRAEPLARHQRVKFPDLRDRMPRASTPASGCPAT